MTSTLMINLLSQPLCIECVISFLQLPEWPEISWCSYQSRMSIWLLSCSFHPDLTASGPSCPSLSLLSSAASQRRRPNGPKARDGLMMMTKTGPNPTAIWRQENPCPLSTETFRPHLCLSHWRTWTPTTATKKYVWEKILKSKLAICV